MTIEDLDLRSATVSGALMVLGRTTLSDLGVTGNINAGLLSINGLDSVSCHAGGSETTDSISLGDSIPYRPSGSRVQNDKECFGSTINTLSGNLYLQNIGLGGIDILAGKVTIDTKGNIVTEGEITAKKINVDTKDKESASIGSGVVTAGQKSVTISSTSATKDSKIFVTATTPTGSQSLFVAKKTAGVGFVVAIEQPYTKDIVFDWWVVN